MNKQQFTDLTEGDEVENALTHSVGKVTKADAQGVNISWGGNAREFSYSVNSTAWYHWNIVKGDREPGPPTKHPGHV